MLRLLNVKNHQQKCQLCAETRLVAIIEKSGTESNAGERKKQFMRDFQTNAETAQAYKDIIRDGLLHQGMPRRKNTKLRWVFHHDFDQPIALSEPNADGVQFLKIQPWLFTNKVIGLWYNNISLLGESNSFPWAKIFNPIYDIPEDEIRILGVLPRKPSSDSLATGSSSSLADLMKNG